jgi:YidC/Oxa1 family membrane protein insertase
MIDTRLLGYITLAFVLLLMYQAWQRDYGPQPVTPPVTAIEQQQPSATPPAKDLPAPAAPSSIEVRPATGLAGIDAPRIKIVTDLLAAEISLQGGSLVQVDLLKYPVDVDHPEQPMRLLSSETERYYVAQSGLWASNGSAPDHYALYTAEQTEYRLQPGATELLVPLYWRNDAGIVVRKEFRFQAGSYVIDVSHVLENHTQQLWSGQQYQQLQRAYWENGKSSLLITYTGGVIYSPEKKYEKIEFEDLEEKPLDRPITDGWAAIIQHYFLSAWVPDPAASNQYHGEAISTPDGLRYLLRVQAPMVNTAPGGTAEFHSRLYVGPKLQDQLQNVAKGLQLTVDYGSLTIIADPLFFLLKTIHNWVGNWGWSIILVTLIIKLLFYKLAEISYRSMAKMRQVQPKMLAIRERYGDDRQRQSQAMMELYRKEKINPLGGCLPMLIQIPVFLALYWVLIESVELRQAPFILWIEDLSTKDPYFVLPLIYGVSMYFLQKQNPAPLDPIQAKIFNTLPFVFTVMFAFFPSGLVLYWVVNNLLTIAQQWYITKHVLAEKK